jgi:hypothetical protein
MQDYVPRSDAEFLKFAANLLKNLFPIIGRVGFPNDEYQKLAALRNTFQEKYNIAEDPATRTKGAIDDKTVARKAFEVELRQSAQQWLIHNPALTNKDHDDLGLPIHDTKPTNVPDPTTHVVLTVVLPGPGEVEIHFRDETTEKSIAKPFGVHGVEICWVISDTPITHWNQLAHSSFSTHPPLILKFDDERGQNLYVAARWENNRGVKGPWSEIQHIIIP